MMVERAGELFHGPEGYNCAQAVLATFAEKCEVPEERIAEFKALGGGRAEGGLCGALYAADTLAAESDRQTIRDEFKRIAGSTICNEIRKGRRLSCRDCVKTAAKLVEDLGRFQ